MGEPLKVWFPIIPYYYNWNNAYHQNALNNLKNIYKCMFGCDTRNKVSPIRIGEADRDTKQVSTQTQLVPDVQIVDIEPVINSYNESISQFGGALHVIKDEYQKLFDVFNTDGVKPDIQDWFIYLREKLGKMPNLDFEPNQLHLDNYKVPVSQEVVDLVRAIHDTIIVIHDALVALEKMSIKDIDLYKLYKEA